MVMIESHMAPMTFPAKADKLGKFLWNAVWLIEWFMLIYGQVENINEVIYNFDYT